MHDELSTVCNKSHSHGSLLGQSCAGRAVVDPPRLVAAILRGLRSGLEQSVNAIDVAEAGPASNRVSHHRKKQFKFKTWRNNKLQQEKVLLQRAY